MNLFNDRLQANQQITNVGGTNSEAKGKELATIEISVVGQEKLEIKTWAKSDIRRVRRITGYLSTVDRFNDAKQEELRDRVVHS